MSSNLLNSGSNFFDFLATFQQLLSIFRSNFKFYWILIVDAIFFSEWMAQAIRMDGNFFFNCPNQIVNGAKIFSISVGNIMFKDSVCFLQMPLASFPKAFRLTEQRKGSFPHFFNTKLYYYLVNTLVHVDLFTQFKCTCISYCSLYESEFPLNTAHNSLTFIS